MSPPDPRSAAALLAESAWLQRLALRLVAEPAGAEDAAQATLAKALARPPGTAMPIRKWLAAVLRNVVRQERRASARREAREQARPLTCESEPADALAERLELHEKLAAAVRGLDEPYRTTVALRFLEQLSPRDVAEYLGVPVKTVHTRLERALVLLRERLDREHGGRETWMRVLLPLLPARPSPNIPGPAAAVPLAPLLAMSTSWKWASASVALVALGFLTVRTLDEGGPRATPAAVAAPRTEPPLAAPGEAERESVETPAVRETVATATLAGTSAAPASVPAPPSPPVVAGSVRDLERLPVAGLIVRYVPSQLAPDQPSPELEGSVESDEAGGFELPLVEETCRIVAGGRGYATVIAPTIVRGQRPPEPPVVYVAPERSYGGLVLDEEGAPSEGAAVAVYLERELARELEPGLLAGTTPIAKGSTGPDGAFSLASVGSSRGNRLEASSPGFRTAVLELPSDSTSALMLTLVRATSTDETIAGRVLHADGTPAEGAYVAIGDRTTRSREDGTFELELDLRGPERQRRAVAILPGFLPAERTFGDLAEGAELVLVLGDAARTIAGRVVDASGEPVDGARVWTTDGEYFGEITKKVGELDFWLSFEAESVIAGADVPQDDGRRARTDGKGVFELTGLLERSYTLHALHPRTLEIAGPIEVQAGSAGVVIALAGEPSRRVAGRVTTLDGQPIAEARLALSREHRAADGSTRTYRVDEDLHLETDEHGRFAFEALCVAGTRLLVGTAESPNETGFALAEQADLEHLQLAIAATCYLRVFLDDPAGADRFELLDERQQSLFVTFQVGAVLVKSVGVQLEGGVSNLITTDERARWLVLRKDGAEVERVPLHLRSGEVNEIRP